LTDKQTRIEESYHNESIPPWGQSGMHSTTCGDIAFGSHLVPYIFIHVEMPKIVAAGNGRKARAGENRKGRKQERKGQEDSQIETAALTAKQQNAFLAIAWRNTAREIENCSVTRSKNKRRGEEKANLLVRKSKSVGDDPMVTFE
jgi:hypothetical protein